MAVDIPSAEAPQVAPVKKNIHIAIDNKLYDLTHFAKVHPGGDKLLEEFNDTDASEYFYAIHSQDAHKKLAMLKNTDIPAEQKIPRKPYFALEAQLMKDGFFSPNYWTEALLAIHTVCIYILAVYLNNDYPFLSCICLALAQMTGGWTGHHLEHSRDSPMRKIGRLYSPIITGFSPGWWSAKHNRHHVSCNEVEHDGDIKLIPFLWLWKVTKTRDRWQRRFQHLYFAFLYASLHIKWQYDSVLFAFGKKVRQEMILLSIHFALYVLFFDLKVVIFGTFIGGVVTAFIVTASHQGEEKIYSKKELSQGKVVQETQSPYEIHDYAKHQLITTRNITTYSWILNYLCGGMQFQIEHHLFPKVPLYKLAQVRPYVMEFCAQNGIEYKEEGFWPIMVRNYKNIEIHAFMEF